MRFFFIERLLIKIFILRCQFTLRGVKRIIKLISNNYLYLQGKADIIHIVVGGCANKRYPTDKGGDKEAITN